MHKTLRSYPEQVWRNSPLKHVNVFCPLSNLQWKGWNYTLEGHTWQISDGWVFYFYWCFVDFTSCISIPLISLCPCFILMPPLKKTKFKIKIKQNKGTKQKQMEWTNEKKNLAIWLLFSQSLQNHQENTCFFYELIYLFVKFIFGVLFVVNFNILITYTFKWGYRHLG